MSERNVVGFRDGDRHGWMASWCGTLERIILGEAARQLLRRPLPDAGLAVLPVWLWRESAIPVGRKDRAAGGGKLLLPVRVVWDSGPLVLVRNAEKVSPLWDASGMGITLSGVVTLTGTNLGCARTVADWGDTPLGELEVPTLTGAELEAELKRLDADGHAAWWEAVQTLERYVERAVVQAHAYISADVAIGHERAPLLDQEALAMCCDRVLLGDEDEVSPVTRLLRRSLSPTAFVHVDPQRYVQRSLLRDSQLVVRKVVGDKPTGSKIRAIARELGVTNVDGAERVLGVYRERFPRDRMGLKRVVAALSVRPMVTSYLATSDGSEGGVRL